jgi:hypothetical protein
MYADYAEKSDFTEKTNIYKYMPSARVFTITHEVTLIIKNPMESHNSLCLLNIPGWDERSDFIPLSRDDEYPAVCRAVIHL